MVLTAKRQRSRLSKKLSDARKKGQVGKSKEVTTAAMLLTFFVLLKFFIGYLGGRFLSALNMFLSIFQNTEMMNLQFRFPVHLWETW